MNDVNWNELYELYFKLYYKLLDDYFLLNAALRQVLSIYDGEVANTEKANAALRNVSHLLDREQTEKANAALLKACRLLEGREKPHSVDPLFAIVRKCCEGLDNLELVTLNIAVQFNGDLPERIFNEHEAIQGLFTENEGRRMHEQTRRALALVTKERLSGGADNEDRLGS